MNTKNSFISLRFLPRFFSLIYTTHPSLFIGTIFLRLIKSLFPIVLLWIGKEIIDELLLQIDSPIKSLNRLYFLIGIELCVALMSDIVNRLIALTDALLGDLYSNSSSVNLIQKTAQLDLSLLEDAEFYDKLERARRQTTARVASVSYTHLTLPTTSRV